MSTTRPHPIVADLIFDGTGWVQRPGDDLGTLSGRELIAELAATEETLRSLPSTTTVGAIVRQQALIVSELRRRARRRAAPGTMWV